MNNDRLAIDEGFLRIFLESRAYNADITAYADSVPQFKEWHLYRRDRALADIEDFTSVTAHARAKLNLTKANVFEVGERLGRVMEATIEKARGL